MVLRMNMEMEIKRFRTGEESVALEKMKSIRDGATQMSKKIKKILDWQGNNLEEEIFRLEQYEVE